MVALLQSTLNDWAAISTGLDSTPVFVGWVGLNTGTLVAVLFVSILTAFIGVYWGLRTSGGSHPTERHEGESGAIDTLKERYVNGDVDAVEFEQRLETLYEDANRSGDAAKPTDSTRDSPSGRDGGNVATTRRSPPPKSRYEKRRCCGQEGKSNRRSKKRGCR